jgi:hypothetical protein
MSMTLVGFASSRSTPLFRRFCRFGHTPWRRIRTVKSRLGSIALLTGRFPAPAIRRIWWGVTISERATTNMTPMWACAVDLSPCGYTNGLVSSIHSGWPSIAPPVEIEYLYRQWFSIVLFAQKETLSSCGHLDFSKNGTKIRSSWWVKRLTFPLGTPSFTPFPRPLNLPPRLR